MPMNPLSPRRTNRLAQAMVCGRTWPSLAAGLLLAACTHSAPAAVPPAAGLAQPGAAAPSACQETAETRAVLARIAQELKDKGLAFSASCPSAAAHAVPTGWVVQVRVVDGLKASKVVRGPLADGHEVDMGTPAGVQRAGASAGATGFSPDVQHNREWLRSLMARHQFENLPHAWWHFAQRGVAPATAAQSDLAAR